MKTNRTNCELVKVKGDGFRIYGTNEYVMIFGSYSVNRRSMPGYIKNRYLKAVLMKYSNNLDLPILKVKVI